MKTMKKMLTLVLALLMVVSLALPAMAADTYTITIEGSKSNTNAESAKGHTYEAYQILTGTMSDAGLNLGNPEWGANVNVATFLPALKADTYYGTGTENIFSAVTTAKEFAAVVAASTFTVAQLEHLAGLLHQHLQGAPVDVSEETAPPYKLEVEAGYYLIKDKDNSLTGLDKDYTDIILHISQDVTVYHKGSVPTIEKTVSEANSAYYESIEMAMQREYYYKLVGTLPSDFDDYTEYEYNFVDTMSAGITFVDADPSKAGDQLVSAIAVYSSTSTEETLVQDAGYTVEVVKNADNTTTLKVKFADLKHDAKHPFQAGDKIIIIYKAKLNENAVVGGKGNDNTAYLEYSNNPNGEGTGKTSSDGGKVYTYGINLTKVDGKTPDTKLEGVKFILYREILQSGGTYIYKYAKVNASGAITEWADNEADATVLTTDANGQITVKGLDSGVIYSLKETSTLDGYNQILDPINIHLTAEKTGDVVTRVWMEDNTHVTDIASYVVGSDVIGVQFNVPNYMGDVLPSTGGVGTTIFYILGAVMALGATLLLITKKRVSA